MVAGRICATAAATLSLVALSATQGASVVERASATPGRTALAALPRVPWEGGAAYYRRFPKAQAEGWSRATFFPIGVFLGKPAHARALRRVGINTLVGVERDGTPLTSVTRTGIFVLPQRDEWSAAAVGSNPRAVGWLVGDECEMGLNGCDGGNEYKNLAIMRDWVAQLRALKDGRFLYANFGNGVLGTFWARNTMRQYVRALDASSVDKYAYTSPHNAELLADSPHWPRGASVARSATYGWLARRMRTFQDPRRIRPTWVFVETAKPYLTEPGARTITPEQAEGAVWAAITNEARGIVYFQHNNDGTCATYSILDCGPALRNRLAAVHAKIRRLAPVLNTQSYRWSFGNGTDTMLKRLGGSAYVFASLGVRGSTGTKTFTLPRGVNGAIASVVGEGRTLTVRNGRFTDTFARESSHHVYRISLAR